MNSYDSNYVEKRTRAQNSSNLFNVSVKPGIAQCVPGSQEVNKQKNESILILIEIDKVSTKISIDSYSNTVFYYFLFIVLSHRINK